MRKRIGIFGGTFDPVHFGHLAVAIRLQEAHKLDQVLFVPANVNPQKKGHSVASSEQRINMLKIALRGIPGFSICDLELKRDGPSYMIDTVRELKNMRRYQEAQFFLLMGEDLLLQFCDWKDPHELVQLAPPLIAMRSLQKSKGVSMLGALLQAAIDNGMTQTPLYDVSATEVRDRLKKGLFCGHLVDKAVLRYIRCHELYGTVRGDIVC